MALRDGPLRLTKNKGKSQAPRLSGEAAEAEAKRVTSADLDIVLDELVEDLETVAGRTEELTPEQRLALVRLRDAVAEILAELQPGARCEGRRTWTSSTERKMVRTVEQAEED